MHLSEYDIACYLDQTLTPNERARIDAHLASCGACSEALAEAFVMMEALEATSDVPSVPAAIQQRVGKLAGPLHAERKWSTPLGMRLALGSLVALVIVLGWWQPWAGTPEVEFRSEASASAFSAIAPADGTAIDEVPIQFIWFDVPGVRGYQIHVYTEEGEQRWEHQTTESHLDWTPEDGLLEPGNRYFWRVQAIQADGAMMSTELYLFTYAP